MTSSTSPGVMAPLVGTVRHGDDSVLGLVDLTKAARCALGGVHRCRSNEVQVHKGSNAPQSCWGSTSYVKAEAQGKPPVGGMSCDVI